MAKKKSAKSGKARTRRGVKLKPTQLTAAQIATVEPSEAVTELAETIIRDGGSVLSIYREPLGGNTIIFAALPIDTGEPSALHERHGPAARGAFCLHDQACAWHERRQD